MDNLLLKNLMKMSWYSKRKTAANEVEQKLKDSLTKLKANTRSNE
jgi:hypothetical protein